MMHPDLSFEQAPPISVPYRFFLTAPWLGVAAGLLLAWQGAAALESRWTPGALALTHLMVAGYMLQAMCGALLQFIPVAAGGNIRHPLLVAGVVHPMLLLGVLLLAAGFLGGGTLPWGALLLGLSLAGYVAVVTRALLATPARNPTILALRAAMFGLAVTLTLGLALAAALSGAVSLPVVEATNVHAGWGLGGWALPLLTGVSYYVVPMFQLTPPYPPWLGRWLPWALLAVLLPWTLQPDGWQAYVLLVGFALAALFAAITLRLQLKRRRRVPDVTLSFFRGAMLAMLLLLATAALFALMPELGAHPRAPLWIGMLALAGFFASAINGMLYKIVPFLNWLHLQREGGLTMLPPNMKDMIPERSMWWQMRLHFAAVLLLLAAVILPALASLAGLAFAVSCAWLAWNLARAVRVYRGFRDRIRAAAASHAP